MSGTSGGSAAIDASDASSTDAVSNEQAATTESTTAEHEPAAAESHIKVLRGNPTDAEIAALIAVLGSAGGAVADAGPQDRNLWGHPVDKLRFPLFSWQRITLLERTHMRR